MNIKPKIIEAIWGQFQFDMKGYDCDLARRIDGKKYFVDGTTIDSNGVAHTDDGFCIIIRIAEVLCKIVDYRFKVTSFKLLQNK